jgi:DNA-binding NarL/FixJ family response regulator
MVADGEPARLRAARETFAGERFRVVADAGDGVDAVQRARYCRPQILLLLSPHLSAPDAVGVVEELARTAPDVRTFVLSAQPDPELEERVLLAGASGYMARPAHDETLLRALEGVACGEVVSSRQVIGRMIDRLLTRPRAGQGIRPVRSPLSDREWQVIDLLSAGCAPAEAADRLALSPDTIDSHLRSAERKLGVRGREAAIAAAGDLIDAALAS